MNILVTGGAGFIGSHLVRALVEKGHNVRVLDNFARNINHVKDLQQAGEIKLSKGDICNKQHVLYAMKGIDYVFHEAAICLNRCLAFPTEAIEVNLKGSYNVFGAAISENVKRVIVASTSSVYGQPEYLPIDEKHPTNPRSPYGSTKLCADHFLKFLAEKHSLKFIGLRYFNVYGINQSADAYYTSVITMFIKRILAGASPIINGSGEQALDFTHVSDVVNVNLACLESDVSDEFFNVGAGKQTSIKELAEMILRILGTNNEIIFRNRQVPITKRCCDNTKMQKMLGIKCETDLEDGLRELVEHVRKYPEVY